MRIFFMNFKYKKLHLNILLITFLIGCSSISNKPQDTFSKDKHNNDTKIAKKQSIKYKIPSWLINPNKSDQICAIGTANANSGIDMKKIAFIRAKAEISKQINIYIESQITSSKNSNGKSIFATSSSHQSTNMLKNIKIVNEYLDKNDNIYYVRACSKIQKKE